MEAEREINQVSETEPDNFVSTLEPALRKVVAEEIDRALKKFYTSTPPTPQPTPRYKLVIWNLLLPIYTGNKILGSDHNPLKIFLVDINYVNGDQIRPILLNPPPKVELFVLNGDFPERGHDSWTSEQFDNSVVKERTGKRPLIIGNIAMLKDGVATFEDVAITDNSSWIPSKMFKIGARLVAPDGTNSFPIGYVLEAVSEAFVVKESRMALCEKHYPPKLGDEIWRLNKISKNGIFHKNLERESITTVNELLNLSTADPKRLRKILGPSMSNKMWEVVLQHAKTCRGQSSADGADGSQQVTGTENALPAQCAMVDQPCPSHVQANKHQLIDAEGEGSMSFEAFYDEYMASTSQPDFDFDFDFDFVNQGLWPIVGPGLVNNNYQF